MSKEFCQEKWIQRQFTILHTPQYNSIVQCSNRRLLDVVRSMMTHANLPISFWEMRCLCQVRAYLPLHMSYDMIANRLWITYAHGVWLVMCIAQPINIENLVIELSRWSSQDISHIPKGMWCTGNIRIAAWRHWFLQCRLSWGWVTKYWWNKKES